MIDLFGLVRSVTHALAALTSNCSHFRSEWEREGRGGVIVSLSGRWVGEWISQANGHHGGLKCIISQAASNDIRACFHATYAKFLRVCYCTSLAVEENSGRYRLRGETDLGKLAGGIYRYEGEASAEEFLVAYSCQYDHGTFHLHRLD
jgi:hypothetical protein